MSTSDVEQPRPLRSTRQRRSAKKTYGTKTELASAAGVSLRQLTHWADSELIRLGDPPFPHRFVFRLRLIRRLVDPEHGYAMPVANARQLVGALDEGWTGLRIPEDPLALSPDLLLNLDCASWVTRRAILYGYLFPELPLEFPGDMDPYSPHTMAQSETSHDELPLEGSENSFLPYREMSLATVEAVAILALHRLFKQAYLAHWDDPSAFWRVAARMRDVVQDLPFYSIDEESVLEIDARVASPVQDQIDQTFVNSSVQTSAAFAQACMLRALARRARPSRLSEEPFVEDASSLDVDAITQAAKKVWLAEARLRRWAELPPGSEFPEAPPLHTPNRVEPQSPS